MLKSRHSGSSAPVPRRARPRHAAARVLLLGRRRRREHDADGFVEDIFEALLRQRRALQVFVRPDLLGQLGTFGGADDRLAVLLELLGNVGVATQIELGSNQDDRDPWRVMTYLRCPFLLDVLE